MNISLSGSYQVTPNFWPDPKTGIPYQLWVQTPEYRNSSLTDLRNTPLFVRASDGSGSGPGVLTLLSSVADLRRSLSKLSAADNGGFFNHDGSAIAW